MRALAIGSGIAFLAAAGSGCDSSIEVDPRDYDKIPALEQLDYSQVDPAEALRYWEYRFGFGGPESDHTVIGSGGATIKDSIDASLIASFDSARAETGFGVFCLPGYCYKYIVAIRGNHFALWATENELLNFLGEIDSREEAIMLIDANGYHWSTIDIQDGAIRDIDDGYELVVLKTVEFCAPIVTKRYLLRVSSTGVITVVEEEERYRNEGACV
jgi:hypothetical protein